MRKDLKGYRKSFGQTLRDYRQKAGLSQEELARLAGIHRTYVGSVERGERNISIINIFVLAEALHSLPSELMRDAEQILLQNQASPQPSGEALLAAEPSEPYTKEK